MDSASQAGRASAAGPTVNRNNRISAPGGRGRSLQCFARSRAGETRTMGAAATRTRNGRFSSPMRRGRAPSSRRRARRVRGVSRLAETARHRGDRHQQRDDLRRVMVDPARRELPEQHAAKQHGGDAEQAHGRAANTRAHRSPPRTARRISAGKAMRAARSAKTPSRNSRKNQISAASGASTMRDQWREHALGGSSRHAVISYQPCPAMRSRTCTMRMASSVSKYEPDARFRAGAATQCRNRPRRPGRSTAQASGFGRDRAGGAWAFNLHHNHPFAIRFRRRSASQELLVTLSRRPSRRAPAPKA